MCRSTVSTSVLNGVKEQQKGNLLFYPNFLLFLDGIYNVNWRIYSKDLNTFCLGSGIVKCLAEIIPKNL